MNKSALRNFAVWARRDLIKRISDRANLLGVYENKPEKPVQATTATGFMINGITFEYKNDIRDNFIKRVKEIGFQDTIEEIAYTWFNRIVALRFMEVNGYLLNGKNKEEIYMIGSSISGKTEPDSVTNADKLSFIDKNKVYDFQDKNDNNGLYRYVLTSQCNELNKVMPQMFEQISDYVELLLPDHLLDNGSIIDHLKHDIDASDFNITVKDKDGENASQVEIIGWLYQFYISEKKEDVFTGLKNNTKITKSTLPAATQLFTPDWIVRYMTDNTLGKMWVESRKSGLKSELKYYLEPAEQTDDVKAKLAEINKEYAGKNVSEITFIDPCCGSGHILVYAFDLLYKMYLESGYVSSDIPSKILQNNLIGIDIDKRAVQLTSFALTMKALSYNIDFLSKNIYPTVIDVKESNKLNGVQIKEFIKLAKLNSEDEKIIEEVVEKFKDAELYGSLIKDFRYSPEQYDILLKQLQNTVKEEYFYNITDQVCINEVLPLLSDLLKEAIILSKKYDVVVTNPPYAGNSGFNNLLSSYANENYSDSKSDMFAMFLEHGFDFLKNNGFMSMVTMQSWMFLQSYEKLRKKLLLNNSIISMTHMDNMVMTIAFGTCATIWCKGLSNKFIASFNYVKMSDIDAKKSIPYNFPVKNERYKHTMTSNFSKIPGMPIAYWATENVYQIFDNKNIENVANVKIGMGTGKNDIFVRNWWGIEHYLIDFSLKDVKDLEKSDGKYFPYNKGGNYRLWYGNQQEVLWYNKEGRALMNSMSGHRENGGYNYYFKEGLTWSFISSSNFGVRKLPYGFAFDVAGSALFANSNNNYILGFLSSKVCSYFLKLTNPTLNYQAGNIKNLPIIFSNEETINKLVENNIDISKEDWDQYETSWDFKINPLIENNYYAKNRIGDCQDFHPENSINDAYQVYKVAIIRRFQTLWHNEEELNKMFIEIYGLQDELTPEVSKKDVTVASIFDTKEDIPVEYKGNNYILTKQDIIKDLISYIVGCAFGRYSPYQDGLIFAGGNFDYKTYLTLANGNIELKNEEILWDKILPSVENCMLISDKEYFGNDLRNFIVKFVKLIYGEATLEENLNFIAEALDDSHKYTSRDIIRKYLFNDFFKYHCKKYQNRPIYWQLDSGKNGGFRALFYLHRYDENTIPTVRLSYLHELQWKYEQDKDRLEYFIKNTNISSEKVKYQRELDLINKQIIESNSYDEILNHASNMRITLDLDDGVKVNYQKLQCLDGDKDKNILSTYLKFKEKE